MPCAAGGGPAGWQAGDRLHLLRRRVQDHVRPPRSPSMLWSLQTGQSTHAWLGPHLLTRAPLRVDAEAGLSAVRSRMLANSLYAARLQRISETGRFKGEQPLLV